MATPGKDIVMLISDNMWTRHGERIRALAPDVTPVIYTGDDVVSNDLLDTINVAFFSNDVWPDRARGMVISIMKAENLAWMHTFSAGVDSPIFPQLMERGVRLTNSSGAASSPIAQTAILYMLALSRNVRAWFTHQKRHEWQRHSFVELEGARLAVIGMGPIGEEIARLGSALNMSVEGVRRSPNGSEPCPTFPFDELHNVLARADWVVLALPLTADTAELFDATMFGTMIPGSHFINVGRGELVNEDALIASLRSGHLAGAALDVFAIEPLPADSPLWDMDNVIITPHSSGASEQSNRRSEEIFLENLQRFISGDALQNEIIL